MDLFQIHIKNLMLIQPQYEILTGLFLIRGDN